MDDLGNVKLGRPLDPAIVERIETARRLTCSNYDEVLLTGPAVELLARIFLNPACRADTDLAGLISGETTPLPNIGRHIVTEAPITLARFAQQHNRPTLEPKDLLSCFALDHVSQVSGHHLDRRLSAAFAFSHILTVGKIRDLRIVDSETLVDLDVELAADHLDYINVFLPEGMAARVGQLAFHHMGVVVAVADTPALMDLAGSISQQQREIPDMLRWEGGAAAETSRHLDLSDSRLFGTDLTGAIFKKQEALRRTSEPEGDEE